MSCCVSFFGRVLLAIIFIGAGVSKFQDASQSVGFLNARYPAFHKHVASVVKSYLQVDLPAQVAPTFIKTHSEHIILGVAGAEVVLGLLVILNQAWAGKLLSLLTLSFVAVIHNPILHGTNASEKLAEQIQALLTIGIAGALLLVGGQKTVCAPAPPSKKKAVPEAPPKKSKRN